MAEPKKPSTKEYIVTSAFVWGGEIKKPGDKVSLTVSQANGLKERGKIEEAKAEVKGKAAAEKAAAD